MELLDCLTAIADPRRPQGRLYPLAPLLFVSVLAVLAGANSYRKIARFIDAHRLRLNDWLGLRWKRAPAHTAIRYAFINLSPEAVEAAFRAHSAALAKESDHPEDCIAVDGKSLKGSFNAMLDKHAAQVLSAFTHAEQLILGHVPIQAKSNEIPAAQQLIEELGLKGRVFTLDAELLVKKTFEVAGKRRQPPHRSSQGQPAQAIDSQVKALASEAPTLGTHRQFDHARQCIEWREVRVFAAAALPAEWDGPISTVIEVRRTRDVFLTSSGEWRKTQKVAYYVSDCTPTVGAKFYAQAVRGHWSIENRQHYVRDVSLGEDRSRSRHNPGIFARLRSFALNILRSSGVTNIAEALYDNALKFERILAHMGVI